jgi:ankyrin repeat protein
MYSVLDDQALDFQDEAGDSILNSRNEDISSSVEILDLEDIYVTGIPKLHRAVQAHYVLMVQSFIAQGVNQRGRANEGKTPLHYAALELSQGLDTMKLLLESETEDIIKLGDDYGQTPPHYAAQTNFKDGIKLIVKYGGDWGRGGGSPGRCGSIVEV